MPAQISRNLRGRDLCGNDCYFNAPPGSTRLLDSLIGDQSGQGKRIGVQIGVTRNAANGARGTDLPIGPVVLGAGGYIITAVAAAPGIASIKVFTIIIGHPGRQCARAGKVAHSVSRAGIQHRMDEVGRLCL